MFSSLKEILLNPHFLQLSLFLRAVTGVHVWWPAGCKGRTAPLLLKLLRSSRFQYIQLRRSSNHLPLRPWWGSAKDKEEKVALRGKPVKLRRLKYRMLGMYI